MSLEQTATGVWAIFRDADGHGLDRQSDADIGLQCAICKTRVADCAIGSSTTTFFGVCCACAEGHLPKLIAAAAISSAGSVGRLERSISSFEMNFWRCAAYLLPGSPFFAKDSKD